MPFGKKREKKTVLKDLFSSVLSQLKKYHPYGNRNLIIYAFFKA